MARERAKIRLHVDAALGSGQRVALGRDQAHYLAQVMRQQVGAAVGLFNGRDGEWRARIDAISRKAAELVCEARVSAQTGPPDLWLLFAPIKKARTDFIAEKAAEMGCRRIVPVFTRLTDSQRVNADRLRAHAIEAAEQCGLVSVPEVTEAVPLERLLEDWPEERRIMFCDESGQGGAALDALGAAGAGPWAVLTGPEGGFSAEEAARLRAMPGAVAVSLGPRIMRADTAAVAALALWQAALGDWR